MRFVVAYSKPNQLAGARLFDVRTDDPDPTKPGVVKAAQETAGPGATILEVRPNDGTVPFERSE